MRTICARCRRPESVCFCHTIHAQPSDIPVLIWQHPDETGKALNTAVILELNLEPCEIVVGLDYAEGDIQNWFVSAGVKHWYLLFPSDAAVDLALLSQTSLQSELFGILVLDGTWRNVRELRLRNAWLDGVRSIAFGDGIEVNSRYRIRKSPGANYLSTAEAVMFALNYLRPELDTCGITKGFECLIENQIRRMGSDTYQKNYLDRKN